VTEARFLTVEQVAERFGVSRWWVYDHADELGRVKFGAAVRFPVAAVDEYEAERLEEAARASSRPVSVGHRQPRSPRNARRRVPLLDPATDLQPGKRAA
jgi:excisionase family DNA binding protein